MSHVLRSISQNSNLIANGQGDSLKFTGVIATDALITFVIGMRDLDPFANAQTGDGQGTAIADRLADPVVTDDLSDTFTQRQALRMVDLDVSNVATWNLDGYLPSLYMYADSSVVGGATDINVNSMYANDYDADADDWTDKPIFDGGVDSIAFNYRTTTYASSASATDSTNPVPRTLSIGSGNLVLALVVMKSGNAIGDVYIEKSSDHSHQQTLTVLASGKCVGTEAHWAIVGDAASFADQDILKVKNPLGYELSVLASVWS